MKSLLVIGPLLAVTAAACGSDDAGFQNGSTAGSAGDGSNAGVSSSAGNGGSANSAGGSESTSGGDGAVAGSAGSGSAIGGVPNGSAGDTSETAGQSPVGGAGVGGGGNAALCPDVFGDYEIQSSQGTCGSLNEDATQSIEGTDIACFAHFVSTPPTGAQGINGGAALDEAGAFTGAMLYLDETQRNPCSGIWNAGDQTMTVTCGGQGDLCTVVLKKSG